jgi:hypothetical protein
MRLLACVGYSDHLGYFKRGLGSTSAERYGAQYGWSPLAAGAGYYKLRAPAADRAAQCLSTQ